jgi:hypothetical protein
MTGAALLLALTPLTPVCIRADEAENKAVKVIEKMGGTITRDKKAKDKPIVGVDLDNTIMTDAGLKHLVGLKQLRELYLRTTQVTDAGLKHLAGLKYLQTLALDETKVTDAGLKHLAALKQLRVLNLSDTELTDAGLKELAGFKQLRKLYLSGTEVTDKGKADLKKSLPKLKILDFASSFE